MPETVDIKAGECVESIAFEKSLSSETIWQLPANDKLRGDREDRNCLLPGDLLTLPDKEDKWEEKKATGLTHIFKRQRPLKEFRFEVLLGVPISGYTVTVVVDGKSITPVVDTTWQVCKIPANSKEAIITIDFPHGVAKEDAHQPQLKYTVQLGYLRPVKTAEGQEDRLRNLGYFVPLGDGSEPTLKQALALFQASHNILPADGIATVDTLNKLKELTADPI